MSKEGRMFAELAEMARKSMPVAVDSNAGIVRTLQLVAEIDTCHIRKGPEDRGAKYFAADADLFDAHAAAAKASCWWPRSNPGICSGTKQRRTSQRQKQNRQTSTRRCQACRSRSQRSRWAAPRQTQRLRSIVT